jgi:hypothetical protein
MKKTVIKRRKRVPAITSAAGRANAALAESASPAPQQPPLPTAPTTSAPLPRDIYQASQSSGLGLSPARPAQHNGHPSLGSTYHDSLGLRGTAVPLQLGGGIGGERKRPWWIEEGREEAERRVREAAERDKRDRDKDQEGVSHVSAFSASTITPFFLVSYSYLPFLTPPSGPWPPVTRHDMPFFLLCLPVINHPFTPLRPCEGDEHVFLFCVSYPLFILTSPATSGAKPGLAI